MVPDEHRQSYKALLAALEQLRFSVLPGRASVELSVDALREAVAEITQQFQQQILGLDLAEIDEAIALRIQSIQTEISKQLRLLAMDTLFLKTARQPETNQQRRRQIDDRLALLGRYCEAILATDSALDPEKRLADSD